MTPPSADPLHDRIRAASCDAAPGRGDQAALLRAEIERFEACVRVSVSGCPRSCAEPTERSEGGQAR